MPWVRLDEQFPEHPKVVAAGPLAGWLHVCALAYCNRMTTDGRIPRGQIPKLADWEGVFLDVPGQVAAIDHPDNYRLAETLVDVGMWERIQGGFLIHDYLKYQPSKAHIEAERRTKSAAGTKGAASRWHGKAMAEAKQTDGTTDGKAMAHAMAEGMANGWPDPDTVSTPSVVNSSNAGERSDGNGRNGNGKAPPAHPDQAVLDHIGAAIGWTTPRRRAELAAVWDWALTILDRRVLEDTLTACVDARHPNYLRQAVTARATTGAQT